MHRPPELGPVEIAVGHELGEVDRAEIADVVGQQRLLATGVGRFIRSKVRHRVVVIGAVDEEHPGLAGLPRPVNDPGPDGPGVELADRLPGGRMEEVVILVEFDRLHKGVGDGDGNIEIGDFGGVVLTGDEIHHVGMIDPKDAHVGAAPGPALLDHIGRGIEQRHERHRARGHAHGRTDNVILGPELREAEPSATTRLMNQRHGRQGVVDAALPVGERVIHRQHEAGGQLPERTAGVHQRRRVRHEEPLRHQFVEGIGQRLNGPIRRPIATVGGGDGPGHPPEEIFSALRRLAQVVSDQVTLFQDRHSVGRQFQWNPWRGRTHGRSSTAQVVSTVRLEAGGAS